MFFHPGGCSELLFLPSLSASIAPVEPAFLAYELSAHCQLSPGWSEPPFHPRTPFPEIWLALFLLEEDVAPLTNHSERRVCHMTIGSRKFAGLL